MSYTSDRKAKKAKQKAEKRGLHLPAPKPAIAMPKRQKGLFLDDQRNVSEVGWVKYDSDIDWKVVRTPAEFREAIKERIYDVYSFDNHLGDSQPITGMDLLEELAQDFQVRNTASNPYRVWEPWVFFHTQQGPETRDGFSMAIKMERYWMGVRHALHAQGETLEKDAAVLDLRDPQSLPVLLHSPPRHEAIALIERLRRDTVPLLVIPTEQFRMPTPEQLAETIRCIPLVFNENTPLMETRRRFDRMLLGFLDQKEFGGGSEGEKKAVETRKVWADAIFDLAIVGQQTKLDLTRK